MKDRFAYSPKELKVGERTDINFKKSPYKFVEYDSPLLPHEQTTREQPFYSSTVREFDNLKKVADETASLRVTMNSKFLNKLNRNSFQDAEEDKGNKLNDFLRSTLTYKPAKAYSETLIPDTAYSGDFYDRDYPARPNKYH